MLTLTAESFSLLLRALDADDAAAAEKYQVMRMKLIHMLCWRGCAESDADDLADIVLDRVAIKIAGGETIENLPAYAASVARFVWLEHSRRKKEDAAGDDLPEIAVEPDTSHLDGDDPRLGCLRDCMAEVIPNPADRAIIVGYYDAEAAEKNKDARKRLAAAAGLTVNALKVRACRLRFRLEQCVNSCTERVTNSSKGTLKNEEAIN